MTAVKLTNPARRAHKWKMPKLAGAMVVVVGSAIAAGCVTVKAPDAPIVIELNINIKQEVIYRLAGDAGNTIEQNQDIF